MAVALETEQVIGSPEAGETSFSQSGNSPPPHITLVDEAENQSFSSVAEDPAEIESLNIQGPAVPSTEAKTLDDKTLEAIRQADLTLIPRILRQAAQYSLAGRSAVTFISCASIRDGIFLVHRNFDLLSNLGILEACFLEALSKTETVHVPIQTITGLLLWCDRKRLLEAGDIVPDGDSFRLYRGVAGDGRKRRERGFSWTSDIEQARSFARRYGSRWPSLRPAVMRGTFKRSRVLAYLNESYRNEKEFLICVNRNDKIETVEFL